jgi:endonuclease YncB( thermonuclease family)
MDPLICLVIAIADGDTMTVRCAEALSYNEIHVRLAEIDAPEKRQPFGEKAKQHLADLCFKSMATVRPMRADRYGRTVARVECQGTDASGYQIDAGLAWAYTKYLTDKTLMDREIHARTERRGIWSSPDPVPPWEWRRHR